MRGSRVQGVVQELRGEKIDIVPYSDDHVRYVCNALSPAKVDRVYMYDDTRSMEVVVPDEQLSLAIGKSGQNVRLAARLTGWKIDVKKESLLAEQDEAGYKSLLSIPGVGERTAQLLFDEGIKSVTSVASADTEMLGSIRGISEKKAIALIEGAKQAINLELEEKNSELS